MDKIEEIKKIEEEIKQKKEQLKDIKLEGTYKSIYSKVRKYTVELMKNEKLSDEKRKEMFFQFVEKLK